MDPIDVGRFVRAAYGLDGAITRLAGEKDENLLLDAGPRGRYLVKVAHPFEDPDVLALQTSVLEYLRETAPELRVPRVVRTGDGRAERVAGEGSLRGRCVRVTTFLEGTLLREAGSSTALRRAVGATAAGLSGALRGFDHPGAHRALLWDLNQSRSLLALVEELPVSEDRDVLEGELRAFLEGTLPRLSALRHQAVHNDLSLDNLLVDVESESLAGVLDFGDLVVTSAVNELAIAASYQLGDDADPIGPALDVVAGFHSRRPLEPAEIELLGRLIRARVVMWLVIPQWRAAKMPENSEYVLRNVARARSRLRRLREVSMEEFDERVRRACNEESRRD